MKLPTRAVTDKPSCLQNPAIVLSRIRWQAGFSLLELMIVIAIFGIVMTGVFDAYLSQTTHSSREYRIAESEIELEIAKQIIEQDLQMAGFGLADDYGSTGFDPRAIKVTNSDSAADQLFIMGTPLGLEYVASRAWSYMATSAPTFRSWGDAREDLKANDRVIMISPDSKKLLTESVSGSDEWLFAYNGDNANLTTIVTPSTAYTNPDVGTITYGLYAAAGSANDASARPYYTSRYYLGDTPPDGCAPGTSNLLRGESITTETPDGSGQALLSCVLDFQVAVALDVDEDGNIEPDNGGINAAGLNLKDMNKYLRQTKVYLLVQNGSRDPEYTYPTSVVRVGEGTTIGRNVTLTDAQRQYRWQLVTLNVIPRNAR